ncbi:MAG: hypothetical protein V2A66_04375 [Pseudomonadota bacterium]
MRNKTARTSDERQKVGWDLVVKDQGLKEHAKLGRSSQLHMPAGMGIGYHVAQFRRGRGSHS